MHINYFLLFCLFLSYATLTAQDNHVHKLELGIDVTPIIVLPYVESNNELGLEFVIRWQFSDKKKLRFRYINNQPDNPATITTTTRLFRFPIAPTLDGTPQYIENTHLARGSHGIAIGYQKSFSVNGWKMYGGMDIEGHITRGETWSESLLENEDPFPVGATFLINQAPFDGAINRYQSSQLSIIPALGIDIPLGNHINFMIEFGAKIGYIWQNVPYISAFQEVNYVNSSGLFLHASPIKDIIIAYRF